MKKNGFTLVELLAVVVVLGLLITLGATSITKIISSQEERAIQEAAKNLEDGAVSYGLEELYLQPCPNGLIPKKTSDTFEGKDKCSKTVKVEVIKNKGYFEDSKSLCDSSKDVLIYRYIKKTSDEDIDEYRALLEENTCKSNYDKDTPLSTGKQNIQIIASGVSDSQITSMETNPSSTNNLVVKVKPGYYLESGTCTNKFVIQNMKTGKDALGEQTVKIVTPSEKVDSVCTFVAKEVKTSTEKPTKTITIATENVKVSSNSLQVEVGGYVQLRVEPDFGYYLSEAQCGNNSTYYISGLRVGKTATGPQNIQIKNINSNTNVTCTFKATKSN